MFNDDTKKISNQGYYASTQRHASKLHYTVTPIANNDLKAWKAERLKIEAVNEEKALERRCRAIDAVERQDSHLIADREDAYLTSIETMKQMGPPYGETFNWRLPTSIIRTMNESTKKPSLLARIKSWFR